MREEEVKKLLLPYLEEHNIELYDVKFVREYGYNVLQVSIDKKGSIDVDILEEVNKYLSPLLDDIDKDWPDYMLEVCSPGAEKPLRNEKEVEDSIGEYIHVKVPKMVYEGYLKSFDGNILSMEIDVKGRKKLVEIDYADIKLIRLAVHF